jgi:hypothetical protein
VIRRYPEEIPDLSKSIEIDPQLAETFVNTDLALIVFE